MKIIRVSEYTNQQYVSVGGVLTIKSDKIGESLRELKLFHC